MNEQDAQSLACFRTLFSRAEIELRVANRMHLPMLHPMVIEAVEIMLGERNNDGTHKQ